MCVMTTFRERGYSCARKTINDMKQALSLLTFLLLLSAGCNSGTVSLKKNRDIDADRYNYIQVKVEDIYCNPGCHVERVADSEQKVCFKKIPILTSADIVRASFFGDNNSEKGYVVSVELNSTGRVKLHMATKENMGKRLGIYVEGRMLTAPVIHSVIDDGKAAIAGGFSRADAEKIASILNYGK